MHITVSAKRTNTNAHERKPRRKPRSARDLAAALDADLQPKLQKAERTSDEERTDGRSRGFLPERGANTRDAQIAICKIYGLSNAQTAAAVVTPESPTGISESSLRRRLSVNAEWIEGLVQWGLKARRKGAFKSESESESAPLKDVHAGNVRAIMERALPRAWEIFEGALEEGNLEMAIWVIEQVAGKANQPHTMHGTIGLQVAWKGRAELIAQERDMLASENMLKMLPAADLNDSNVSEAELVNTE